MLPNNYWQKELLVDFKDKKPFLMKFILPMILLSPLMVFPIPLNVKAIILTIFILFTGTLGSSVKLSRLRESGMMEKLAVMPLSPPSFLANYIFANSLFDGLQLIVPTVLIILSSLSNYTAVFWIALTYISVILAANSIGILVALLANSSAEVHLYSTLTVLIMGALSVPFSSSINSFTGYIGNVLPFHLFYNSLLYGWGILTPKFLIIAPLTASVFLILVLLLSPRLFNFNSYLS
jgi:hypothetical protein